MYLNEYKTLDTTFLKFWNPCSVDAIILRRPDSNDVAFTTVTVSDVVSDIDQLMSILVHGI